MTIPLWILLGILLVALAIWLLLPVVLLVAMLRLLIQQRRLAPWARRGRAVWAGGEWQWVAGDRYGRLGDFDASARDALADITLDDRIRYREAHDDHHVW